MLQGCHRPDVTTSLAARRVFWAAVWLALLLVGTKAFYLGLPASLADRSAYLRSLAATGTEKSTINTGTLNAVSKVAAAAPAPVPMACSLSDPDCEACQ